MDKKHKQSLKQTFEAIYKAESDAVFRFCLVKVSDREQALDITQETFTRLWQSINKDTKLTNERAFIFTIANHLIIDWYRKKKSLSLDDMTGEENGEPYEPFDDMAHDNIKIEAEGRFLLNKINDLGDSYRQAVYLRFVEGLSPSEISKVLGLSVNATSVRITRGIEELRKLTGYDIDEDTADKQK